MKDSEIHLSEEQLICAVVQEDDLGQAVKNHLLACSKCKTEKKRFEHDLNSLGRLAKDFTPKPVKRPAPALKDKKVHRPFRPIMAAGFALMLLLVALWWTGTQEPVENMMYSQILQEMEEDIDLMEKIERLESLALSGMVMETNGESYEQLNEEFLNFVVPVENGSYI